MLAGLGAVRPAKIQPFPKEEGGMGPTRRIIIIIVVASQPASQPRERR